ncbi:MAG: GTP-binding protein [Candidatus Heimdallarchaeota archaeon]|nr:GTP-binding protein [Candidatus Heimdallarchaeota archaeon]
MSRNIDIIEKWSQTANIRNLSIISHVDHGKTTLSDHFIAYGGILPKHLAGQLRALDDLPEEQRRGITIETSYTSIIFDYLEENFLINIIDTPGHVDFSGKVAESLRLVDGAFILVDAVEGIMAQTKTVLRQAIKEKVQLVLFINKVDRLILELGLRNEKIQERIERIIGEIHSIFHKYKAEKKNYPSFANGSIILGSAFDGWAVDNEFVKRGGKISQIVEFYKNNKLKDLIDTVPIMNCFARTMVTVLPSPQVGQKIKFPSLFVAEPSKDVLAKIYNCDFKDKSILLVGRGYRIQNSSQISYIIRMLSGTLKRGDIVKPSYSDEKIRITKIFQIIGKTAKDIKEIKAGQIAGIIVSKSIIPGDVLTTRGIEIPEISDISYVQDPVVAIGIETLNLKEIGKLEHTINDICQVTPGLEFEINKDTGELIAMGVGTLQLEILKSELEALKFDLEISDPKVLKFEMATETNEFNLDKWDGINGIAGQSDSLKNDLLPIFSDSQNNHLITKFQLNKETEDGLIEVFRQYMLVSPLNSERIRNFSLIVANYPNSKKYNTYENGMIIGSSIIKNALLSSITKIHEPYYHLEINIPEQYLGAVLQELYKFGVIIDDVKSYDQDSVILGKLAVEASSKLADQLRQITDGNVFWSFASVLFQPILIGSISD